MCLKLVDDLILVETTCALASKKQISWLIGFHSIQTLNASATHGAGHDFIDSFPFQPEWRREWRNNMQPGWRLTGSTKPPAQYSSTRE